MDTAKGASIVFVLAAIASLAIGLTLFFMSLPLVMTLELSILFFLPLIQGIAGCLISLALAGIAFGISQNTKRLLWIQRQMKRSMEKTEPSQQAASTEPVVTQLETIPQ